MTEEQITQTIARILASTKRQKRNLSVYDIAVDINKLKTEKGSLEGVASIIGISTSMLNQFLSVFKLTAEIQELVKSRQIDSVSAIHALSKFGRTDMLSLSKLLLRSEVNSQDLRTLLPFRKAHPTEPIEQLLAKVNASKNIKVSVIKANKDGATDIVTIRKRMEKILDATDILTIDEAGQSLEIKITKDGERKLRDYAKQRKLQLQQLITHLIEP